EYCNYFLSIGGSLGPNLGSTHSMRAVSRAMERGMKLVVVDPRCSPEAAMADEWVPIRPGTDLAFTLSILHVMVYEVPITALDLRFIKERTNAVYLIGEDKLYVTDKKSGKPLVWDSVEGRAKTFDDPTIQDYALAGTYQVDGREATPAFALVKERMQEYTPEWAEKITTVPAATIRRIAHEFVEHAQVGATITIDGFEFPFRPVVVKAERGSLSNFAGAYQHFAAKMIASLVGALDVPGSYLGSEQGPVLSPGPDGVVEPKSEAVPKPWMFPPSIDLREYYPHRHTSAYLAWKAILEPEKYGLDYN
ncbi:MAG: molybdopterin-dependent oxidoreductase, partial [Thermoleophilia bacterium]|nr:molybdopterin-dependent oxidoreductase [Thermoleophilia bacterium]